MRWLAGLALFALLLPAWAQEADLSVSARYWLSTGSTKRSHNAQSVAPVLGNPTSTLTYRDLDAHVLELSARKGFGRGFYVRGSVGVGEGSRGTLVDEDFLAGQFKFSESTSSVRGVKISYWMADVGRELWSGQEGRVTAGPFVGLTSWKERADAYGASFPVNLLGAGPVPLGVPVISNEVTWRALRLGIGAKIAGQGKARVVADVAWLPYAELRDDDSHYLRTAPSDLGPVPNIRMNGRGWGFQGDVELRYPIADNWEAGVGLRYWWIEARRGNREAAGFTLPVTQFESTRVGLTASISRVW